MRTDAQESEKADRCTKRRLVGRRAVRSRWEQTDAALSEGNRFEIDHLGEASR